MLGYARPATKLVKATTIQGGYQTPRTISAMAMVSLPSCYLETSKIHAGHKPGGLQAVPNWRGANLLGFFSYGF